MKTPKRLPMRLWIKEKLDEGVYPQMKWINRDEGKFQVAWRHGSRSDWRYQRDMMVFREWASYTGVFDETKYDAAELGALCKRWKTNFRCALNSLPEIEQVKSESEGRGQNARKVYIMREDRVVKSRCSRRHMKESRRQRERKLSSSSLYSSSSTDLMPDDHEIINIVDQLSDDMKWTYTPAIPDDLLEIRELMYKDYTQQPIHA